MGDNSSSNAGLEWTPQTITAVVIASMLTILTVFGNVLVVLAVMKFKRLQIPSNYILVNLAAADISVAIFTPLLLIAELQGYLFKNIYACMVPYSLVTLGCGVSLLNLGVVAYDRYAALVRPLKYYLHITAKRVIGFSVAVWLYTSIIAFMPLCWHAFFKSEMEVPPKCTFYQFDRFVILFQVIMIFVPAFILMVGCYCHVMLVARHHSRAISAIQLSLFPNSFNKHFHMFKGTKYSRTLLIILGFFCLTWVIFIMALLVDLFCEVCRKMVPLHQYAVFLIFANSSMNPWIYAHRNQDFKAAFRRLLRALTCRKRRPKSASSGSEGQQNSRVSDALSRTNSIMGGLQHLHVLYDNADTVPSTLTMETCQQDSKTSVKFAAKLIQHENSKPVAGNITEDISNV